MVDVTQHEHPLRLIDLQPNFPHYEEDYDDDSNDDDESGDEYVSSEKDFRRRQCNRCEKEINWFHRYYYECITHSCDYSLHKFCGDLPLTLKHTSHPDHTLTLTHYNSFTWDCVLCRRSDRSGFYYECFECGFKIHANCVTASTENPLMYYPSHIHPLAAILKPILSDCNACGKKHNGAFYMCTTCFDFCIHSDCAFLPKTLRIQETTDKIFSHNHPLILSYSFPKADQEAKFLPRCRVCNENFTNENLWIYKCDKCRYYTHLDCAISREEPFMSIISSSGNRLEKNHIEYDYSDLIHLPFPDESYSMLKHLYFKEKGYGTLLTNENNLRNFHQHPLTLVHTSECNDISKPSSSRTNNVVSCHNPMKKIELLCNGCVRPITSMPFYKCANEDENCNFVLHEWCTRVPIELKDYQDHPQHTLVFHPNVPDKSFSIFFCDVCGFPCNGFAYSCLGCDYHIDVKCGFIPEKITHKAHPGHILSRVHQQNHSPKFCRLCVLINNNGDPFSFLCYACNVYVHVNCALLLPREIRHKCDKHPLSLSYFPVENHKGEYYCEVCEEDFDPEQCFYHCYKCVQSIHSPCAPLIVEFERARYNISYYVIYEFVNVKFGGIHNVEGHRHPLLFAQGINDDGRCVKCNARLEYKMIFKCQQCKFAVDLDCCRRLSN